MGNDLLPRPAPAKNPVDSSIEKELSRLRVLLRAYGVRPNKRLGQNFLLQAGALRKVVDAASLSGNEAVLEIGAGAGSLTLMLARNAARVVAVELDERLRPLLAEALRPYPNVRLVFGDILRQNIAELMGNAPYAVVANIPYYITSAVIRHVLTAERRPERLVLTVQREVAQRITAEPPRMNLLALSVQVFGEPKVVARLPAGAFFPPPKVDSAVVRVDVFPEPLVPAEQLDSFFRLANAGFSQRRKQLRNSLAAGLGMKPAQAAELLSAAGIDPSRRAESLSIENWRTLAEKFSAWNG